MKIYRKLSSACMALLCAMVLMVSGAMAVYAADETASSIEATLSTTAEGLTDAIVEFGDEEIEAYKNSGDAFTESAMIAWESSKEELGELKDHAGDTEVTFANKEYTVTVPMEFEKAKANFTYLFTEQGVPESLTVDIQYPMSVTLQRAGLNTLMGIGTVFAMLVFLSGVIYLLRFVPALVEGKKKEKEGAAAPVPAAPAPAPVEETVEADDIELIAVIAAAIAAAEGTSPDGFVVRSIRKAGRSGRR